MIAISICSGIEGTHPVEDKQNPALFRFNSTGLHSAPQRPIVLMEASK
jgi:hypothetical protein